jgi:hypothetical protein
MMVFKKKGQVTIFVILGLLLIIGVFIFIFMSRSDSDLDFFGDDPHGRLRSYVSQCSDLILDDFISRALITGGYGFYPDSVVSVDGRTFVLSFSAEEFAVIHDSFLAGSFLVSELGDVRSCVDSLLEVDFDAHGDNLSLDYLSYEVFIEEEVILVNYSYHLLASNVDVESSFIKSYSSSLGFFLDKTNDLTYLFVEERVVDELLNYQFCQSMLADYGFIPKYSVDFLKDVDSEGVSFLFYKEFFVVFLERNNEVFPFAVLPVHDGYFC